MAEQEPTIEQLLAGWPGEQTVISFDPPSGAWMIVAIHSTRLGPGAGGTRMRPYPTLAAALRDALDLAAAMTYKFAVAGFAAGGAKAVIALPADFDAGQRPALLRRYGQVLARLRGGYLTGPDMGTSLADMALIAETGAPYVAALPAALGGSGDSGPPTALGVFGAIEAVAEQLGWHDAAAGLAGLMVLVQGLGEVGAPLVKFLAAAGAEVLVSDLDSARAETLAHHPLVRVIPPDQALTTPCDILAPCALGGMLDARAIPRLRCRAVAGAANNQLGEPAAADWLHQRGILYAPDFAINGGGALYVLSQTMHGLSAAQATQRVRQIGQTLREIFAAAAQAGITPEAAARQRAERMLRE